MINRYLSLVRDEVKTGKITRLGRNIVEEYLRNIYSTLFELKAGGVLSEELFHKYIVKMAGDADLLVRLRIMKAVLGADTGEDSIDTNVLEGIKRIVVFLRDYIAGNLLLIPDMSVVVRARETLVYRGRIWREGDIGAMDLATASFYYAQELVEPMGPVYRLLGVEHKL